MNTPRKTTKVWLFNNSFGKDPSLNYINDYHPTEDDAKYHMFDASYQRLDAPVRYRINSAVSYNDVINCPYLMFKNANERTYYAFVTDCKYINDGVAELSFKIDPFTTYLHGGINDTMFVERQTGSFSNPDPELSFDANQFMREINVLDKNDSNINRYLLQDCVLIYVRNNFETTDGIHSNDRGDIDADTSLDWLPDLKRLITYDRDGLADLNQSKINEYFGDIEEGIKNDDMLVTANYGNGGLHIVNSMDDTNEFNGNYTGYDVYLFTNITSEDDVYEQIIDDPKFYGSSGCNIIGAEYRKLMVDPLHSDGLLSLEDRKRICQPFRLDIGDFDFPNGTPKELQQSPYFKRLFVSNNGSSIFTFNPNASATQIDSNDSNLTSVDIIDSAEKGSPIVYIFNSSDSNNQKQYYVDTTDRSIPVFADPRMVEYFKNIQNVNNEITLDVQKLAIRLDNIKRKYKYQDKMNWNNYKPVNSDRLEFNQKAEQNNLKRQQNNSKNNLSDSNNVAINNLERTNLTRVANLERTISTAQANLSRTQNAEGKILGNQQTTDDNNLLTSYDAKYNNTKNNYKHSLFVAENAIALNSLNLKNTNSLDKHRIENNRDLSIDNMKADYEQSSNEAERKANNMQIKDSTNSNIEWQDLLDRQFTDRRKLEYALGTGAVGTGLAAVAKGFEQAVAALVVGAVSYEAAKASLKISQRMDRLAFAHRWGAMNPVDFPSQAWYLKEINPDYYDIKSRFKDRYYGFNRGPYRSTVGADDSDNVHSVAYPQNQDEFNDIDDKNIIKEYGLNWYKTSVDVSQIYANVKDEYEYHQPTKINNVRYYANEILEHQIDNRQDNFDESSKFSRSNIADDLKRNNNNLDNDQSAETTNLSRTHKSQSYALSNRQSSAYNNLAANNETSRNNLKAENTASEKNLSESNKVAMGNLLRDIQRENSNLKTTQSTQTNSLYVDWVLKNNAIIASVVYTYLDEFAGFNNDYLVHIQDFINGITNVGLRGSIPITTANYWSQVFSKLNMFKVYDISINAREMRYCINYIKRYGSYCGLVKYGITFTPNTYIRTRDYHMAPEIMPTWAADEISEHLNTGVYIRE